MDVCHRELRKTHNNLLRCPTIEVMPHMDVPHANARTDQARLSTAYFGRAFNVLGQSRSHPSIIPFVSRASKNDQGIDDSLALNLELRPIPTIQSLFAWLNSHASFCHSFPCLRNSRAYNAFLFGHSTGNHIPLSPFPCQTPTLPTRNRRPKNWQNRSLVDQLRRVSPSLSHGPPQQTSPPSLDRRRTPCPVRIAAPSQLQAGKAI